MTFQIEKQSKWNGNSLKTETHYFVWVDSECIACCNTEEIAKEVYDKAKKEYIYKKSEIILKETID